MFLLVDEFDEDEVDEPVEVELDDEFEDVDEVDEFEDVDEVDEFEDELLEELDEVPLVTLVPLEVDAVLLAEYAGISFRKKAAVPFETPVQIGSAIAAN